MHQDSFRIRIQSRGQWRATPLLCIKTQSQVNFVLLYAWETAYASVSVITQLVMHHALHDTPSCVYIAIRHVHRDSSRVTRVPGWTLGNESDCMCYPMSGRQSTCCCYRRLRNSFAQSQNCLHKSGGSAEWSMHVWKQLGNMEKWQTHLWRSTFLLIKNVLLTVFLHNELLIWPRSLESTWKSEVICGDMFWQ